MKKQLKLDMIHFIMMLPGVNTLILPRPTDYHFDRQLLNRDDRPLYCGKKRSRKTQVQVQRGYSQETGEGKEKHRPKTDSFITVFLQLQIYMMKISVNQ